MNPLSLAEVREKQYDVVLHRKPLVISSVNSLHENRTSLSGRGTSAELSNTNQKILRGAQAVLRVLEFSH